MLKKIIVVVFYLLPSAFRVKAQDIHFSQFFESPTLRNPALTGIFSGDYKATVNYRSQWGAFVVPYQTAFASGETKVLLHEATKDYLSFGLTAAYDKAGSLSLTSNAAYAAVNYNKALGAESETYLSVGLCGGYIQRSFDASRMRTASQFIGGFYNSSAPTGEAASFESLHHWDMSAGVSLSGALGHKASYYLGAAGYHVGKPQESYYDASLIRLTTRWSGNAGFSARLGHGYNIIVHANYQYQEPYNETIAGMLIGHVFHTKDGNKKVTVSAGSFYRIADAVIPMLKMEYDAWTLTASYDVAVNSKRLYLSGAAGYELSLSLRGSFAHKKGGEIMCPRFELQDIDVE